MQKARIHQSDVMRKQKCGLLQLIVQSEIKWVKRSTKKKRFFSAEKPCMENNSIFQSSCIQNGSSHGDAQRLVEEAQATHAVQHNQGVLSVRYGNNVHLQHPLPTCS